MKVVLVNPGRGKNFKNFAVSEPLNLGYIASYLEQNKIKVKIIDELAGENVRQEIISYGPDIVGITGTTVLAPDAYRIANMCKEMGILTVMGGVHATVIPEEALIYCDVVVTGEGEVAMLDIIREGIKSGNITRPNIQNLDEIPPPARHLFNMDFYMDTKDRLGDVVPHLCFVPPRTKFASVITSRGCPYRCIFCHNSWRQIPVRFHSAGRVISELEHLVEVYGIEAVFFMDDNFLANKPRLEKICRMMKERKLDIIWGCAATSNDINLPICQMIKDVGCRELCFGWESGSQRILDILGKKTTVTQNKKAIKICKEAGLLATGSFIVGSPTETIEDVRATIRFIEENVSDIDMYGVNIATPYPGTKLWQWCNEQGLIPESFDWSDFNMTDVPVSICDIPPKELDKLQLEIFGIKPVKFSRLLKRGLWHPLKTAHWALRYPSTAANIILGSFISLKNKR